MKVYFCYEKNFANRWVPKILYSLPSAQNEKIQGAEVVRSKPHELSVLRIIDYKKFLDSLIQRFPPPKETEIGIE